MIFLLLDIVSCPPASGRCLYLLRNKLSLFSKQLACAFGYLKDMRLPSSPRRSLKLYIAVLVCTCIFCIGHPLLAQGGFPLQGTVTNSVTGEAIRRASVQALGPRPRAALTDDEGHFRLEGLPEGEVPIAVTKPGYLPEQAANPSERAPKIGSFTIYSSKTPITAGRAMSASSARVSSITTRNNRTN